MTDDSGGVSGGRVKVAAAYDGSGLDVQYGLATNSIVDPGGLALSTSVGFEPPGASGYLRRTTRTLPSGAATTITTSYYGDSEQRVNPCPGGVSANQAGLPKATTQATPSTGPAVAVEVVYDDTGRVVASGHRNGGAFPNTWTCLTYDTRGRATTVTTPAYGSDTTPRTTTTSYGDTRTAPDDDPRATRVTDPSGTVATTVDLLGRTTSYTDTTGVVTTTAYDIAGRATTTTSTAPGGGSSTLGWTYLDDGRVSTLSVDAVTVATVAYDAVTAETTGVTYAATGAGTLTLGGITRTAAGVVKGQSWTIGGSRTLSEVLTRSQAGRITRSVATDTAGAGGTVDWSYGYDQVGRLTQASLAAAGARPAVVLGYGYAATGGCGVDPAAGKNGSRTSTTVQIAGGPVTSSAYCTDNASRLTSVTSSTGGLVIDPATVAYDTHGNATQVGTQTWVYDGADRVTGTSTYGITPTQSLTYTRDPLGRVSQRSASGPDSGLTRFAFTGTDDSPDIQLTATNALSERYVGLPGGVLYTKGYAAASTVWSISNLHGDVTTTITGTTISTGFVYDPYGQPLHPTTGVVDTTATPTTRTGGTTDAWHGTAQRGYEHVGGLHQMLMGARTYLPALGIFTATDPVEGGNTTTYTHPADPINHSDLTGMCDGFLGCIGAAASAAGSWAVEHRGAIATGAATAGCMIPAVGWAACGAMQAAAWGVRTQQSLAEGGSVKDAAVDAGFTALTFGYGRLIWGALRYGQAGSLRNMLGGAVRSGWTRQTVGSVWGGSGVRGIGAARLPRAVKGHLWVSTRAANLYPLYRHAMSFRDRDW